MLATTKYENLRDGADFSYQTKKGRLRLAIKVTGDDFLHLSLAKRRPVRCKANTIADGLVSCDVSWLKEPCFRLSGG
jgi:hypothetical protein